MSEVSFSEIPPARIPARTSPTEVAPIGRAPIGRAPIGRSPIGRAPIGRAPIGRAPIGRAPIGRAPIGRAPIGRAPLLDAALSSFPLLRDGGWTSVLAHTCGFSNRDDATCQIPQGVDETATATPQSVTWNQLLHDPFATDGDPTTLPELVPTSPVAIRLDEIVWELSPIRDVTFLSFMLGAVTWNDVTPPAGGWCSQWTALGHPCSQSALAASIFESETAGLHVDLTSLPDVPLSSLADPSRTLFWSTTIADTNIGGSALGDVAFGDISSLSSVVDCSGEYCADPDTPLRRASNDGRIRDSATFEHLGLSALGPLALSQIGYAFIDPSGVDWENAPLHDIRFEDLPAGNPSTFVRYTLSYTIACASASEMTAVVTLPNGFRYRPGSSTVSSTPASAGDGSVPDPRLEPPGDRDGSLLWELSSLPCEGNAGTIALGFDAMPGFDLGTFSSSATVTTASTSASVAAAAPVTVRPAVTTTLASPEPVAPGSLVVGHLEGPGDRAFYSFTATPGDEIVVTLSHLADDADLVLYAPDGSRSTPTLRSTSPEPVPFGKGPATDPAGTEGGHTLPPEPLQDVPIEPGKVVAGVSSLRGTEQEALTVTATRGSDASPTTYIAQVSASAGDHGLEPFVLAVRTSVPHALPACQPRTFPFAQVRPIGAPNQPPVIGEATDTLILVDTPRLAAVFGLLEAADILRELGRLRDPSLGFTAQLVDVSLFPGVNEAFEAADQDPCSPEKNDAVVLAINDAVDSLKTPLNGNLAGLRWITIVGDDDLIPHARIPDQTTVGNERGFAGDTFFSDGSGQLRTNQYGGAFGNGYYLSDAPYGSFRPLSIFGQTIYPMQVAIGRLGGSASTITSAIQLFLAAGGRADPRTAATDPRLGLVTDYDFATDGGDRISAHLASGGAQVDRLSGAWTKDEFRSALVEDAPHLVSPNAHYDQYRLLPGAGDAGTWTEDDLFTTRDLDTAPDDALRLRVLFGIGCHFGLGVPERLATLEADAPRTLDWAQVAIDHGTAALIGNLGYGYGDTSAVGFSEQLMANLADNLVDAGTIGEALTRAEQDYLLSMGSFSPYDVKTLQQTVMWGLPMYRLPAGGTPAAGAGPDEEASVAVAGFEDVTVQITPSFERVAAQSGSYDRATGADVTCTPTEGECVLEPDEGVQLTHPYPIVPRVVTHLPQIAGLTARGAVMLGVPVGDPVNATTPRTEISETSLDVAFTNATIDGSALEHPTAVPAIYPATPQAITTFIRNDGTIDQRLVVLPGQFRSGDDLARPGLGSYRRFTTSRWLVTYSSEQDAAPPQIVQVNGTPGGGETSFAVVLRDPGNEDGQPIARVVVDALPLGGNAPNVYRTIDLEPDPADPSRWIGSMPFNVREFVVFAVDTHGNVASATNGGAAYAALDKIAPEIEITVGTPQVDVNGGAVVRATTPITVSVTDAGTGVDSCVIDVRGPESSSPACTAGDTTFTMPATSGAYSIDVGATDVAGNDRAATLSLTVDETAPEISITSPEARAYELGASLVASYSCSDVGAGVAVCEGSAPDGGTLPTLTVGQQTLSVTARDRLGNLATGSVTYVVGYGVCLLYDPDQPVKLTTSTVPIKLTLCDTVTGANLSSSSRTLTATRLVRIVDGEEVAAPLDPNPGTGTTAFRFAPTLAVGGGYIYNLQTKGLAPGASYRLWFTVSGEPSLPDGAPVEHAARFTTR